ncbi:MAG: carbonic anhydrase, partial [Bacteroidota bacterium]
TPALAASDESADVNDVVRKNAELTAEELKARSSIIKGAVDQGKLEIVPAYYNLDSGKIDFL